GHRAQFGVFPKRIAAFQRPDPVTESRDEPVVDGVDHDEALRRDARLTRVLVPSPRADTRRLVDVRAVEDDERIRSAELQNARLQLRGRGRSDGPPGWLGACEGDGGDGRMLDDGRDLARRDLQRPEKVAG